MVYSDQPDFSDLEFITLTSDGIPLFCVYKLQEMFSDHPVVHGNLTKLICHLPVMISRLKPSFCVLALH